MYQTLHQVNLRFFPFRPLGFTHGLDPIRFLFVDLIMVSIKSKTRYIKTYRLLISFSVSKEDVEGHGESQFPLSNESLENQVLTFYIKAFGKRTLSFYQKAVNQERVKLRISRPLGRPQLDLSGSEYGDYKTIVLIADGVGITPWISVLQYVHKKEHTIKTRSVQLIWSIHTIGKGHHCARTRKALT